MVFERLGSLTYRFRYAIVLAWVAAAAWAVLLAPTIASQGVTDQTAFLPAYVESMQAHDALERTFPGTTSVSSATIAFTRDAGLTEADRAYMAETAAWITGDRSPAELRDAVAGVDTTTSRPELASMLRSDDGRLELMTINLDVAMVGGVRDLVVGSLREHLATTAPAGLQANVTGAAGIANDYLTAVVAGTDSTTVVTILLVLVILLLIYRAPLAAMVPLVTIGAGFVMARGILGVLALAGWEVSSLIDTFIVVLIFGVGTDYTIFLISRFREEVAHGDWHRASRSTVGRIGAVISASAATVIVGLGAMAFGDFGMIQTTGPALALGIFVTLIAGLTLAPALLAIFGHYLFWPLHTRAAPEGEPTSFFARLASGVSRRPGLVTIVLLVALFIPVLYVPQMRTNFDVIAELPADSDARAGFDQVARHLGGGQVFQSAGIVSGGTDTDLLQPASLAGLLDVMRQLAATPGIASATSLVTPDGDGVLPDGFRPSKQLDEMAKGFDGDTASEGAPADQAALLDPDVSDGLDMATTYLTLLGATFPDVAAGPEYRAAIAGLAKATDQVKSARAGAVVSAQLRTLAKGMRSPVAAAGDAADSMAMLGDYLDELAAAFPEASNVAAFADAKAAVASLSRKVSISAALDLSTAFESLATSFDDRPDATLIPNSLAGTADAKQAKREIEATFKQLPLDLDALAAVFAARSDDVFIPTGLGGEDGKKLDDAVAAFVSEDRSATRFFVSTRDDPYAEAAFAAVRQAQEVLADAAPGIGAGVTAHLGGTTAQFADVQAVLSKDFERVGFITIIGILLVLMLLLRAVVAPLYLVGTVLLSYGTALGLSSWFFQSVLGQPGVSFYLPVLVFVLLVSLGSDYNIFLMSRVREESAGRPIRDGVRIASGHTGAVITSAGLILAGTFGSMISAPLVVLFQVGVAVALGVLIDTFVVRSILVPAITTLIGERVWWPSGASFAGVRSWRPVIVIPEPSLTGASGSEAAPQPSRRRLGNAVTMIILVPVLFAGLMVWALPDPVGNLGAVAAAVVNEDDGAATTSDDGAVQRLDLGTGLVERLTGDSQPDSFAWVATDAKEARDGLADGRYAAVLTIPADFSRSIPTISGGFAGDATRATLRLETNDGASYALGPIARSLSAAIAASTADGVTADYVDRVLVAVNAAHGDLAGAADDASQLVTGSTDVVDGASGVSTVAHELADGLGKLADGTAAAGSGFRKLAAGLDDLAAGSRRLSSGATALDDGAQAAADGAAALERGAQQLKKGSKQVAAASSDLAGGAARLSASVTDYADAVGSLAQGCAALGGSDPLCAQLQALAATNGQLTGGAAAVAGGAAQLAKANAGQATGAGDLAAGARALADGVSKIARGAGGLATGARAVADGASAIASGTSSAAQGARRLDSAMRDAAEGAQSVAANADGLSGDVQGLADDATTLAADLGEAAAAIPPYSALTRGALRGVVANPVAVESTRLNAVGDTGSGLAPSFMALALWVGAMAIYLILPPLPGPFDRRRWWLRPLTGFAAGALIGIAQALLMVLVLRFIVGVEIARMPELVAWSVLTSLAFVAINQALVALLGYRGWLVALFFTVLQLASSGAWFPIETAPAFFRALHPFLPMTSAVEAFRVLVAGGGPWLATAGGVLVLWLAGALGTTLIVVHHRATKSDEPALATAGAH